MTSILESMGYIQQQGEAGKKRGLMSLVGQSFGADPAQRQQILSTVAQRGGADMAFEAQKHFSGMEDTSRKQLGQDAAALLALPEAARAQAYPAFAMKAQQLGIPAPTEWDSKFAQGLGQLASAFGASKAVDLPSSVQEYQYAQQHPEFQDFLNGRQPTQLTSIPVPGGTQTVQWNPRTKTMTDLQGNVINADGSPANDNTVTDFKVEPGADIPSGDMSAVLAAAQHPGQVFTPQAAATNSYAGRVGFKPDKSNEITPYQQAQLDMDRQRLAASQSARDEAAAARKAADEVKAQQKRQTEIQRQSAAVESAGMLLDAIDQLQASPGYKALGTAWGDAQINTPIVRNDAKDARAQLKTISGQIALTTMNRLKALSSQGATGFGALSAPELKLLENSLAALNSEDISNAQLGRSLKVIREAMDKIAKWSPAQTAPQQAPSPAVDDTARRALLDKY